MLVREGNKIRVDNRKNVLEKVKRQGDVFFAEVKDLDNRLDDLKLIFDFYGDYAEVLLDQRSLKDKIKDFVKGDNNSLVLCALSRDGNADTWTMYDGNKPILKNVRFDKIEDGIRKLYNKAVSDK